MTTPLQAPIGSGFDATTTARRVLTDVDLHDRVAVVTGGYSGLGLETTRALAKAGAHVWVPARRVDHARQCLATIADAQVVACDLADLASVAGFARDLLSSVSAVDLLINAAGVMAVPEERIGPGRESHLAINHLGHFALTNQLWPAMARRGARVVSYSSAGHHLSPMRWDDLDFRTGYDRWLAYGQSKTANALFAVEVDRRGHGDGIRGFSLHPGSILTPLQRHMTRAETVDRGWTDEHGRGIDPSFKSPEQGAATGVWAATSPLLDDIGGVYCEDCDVAPVLDDGSMEDGGVRSYAIDPDQAQRLWQVSVDRTGLDTGQSG